MVKALSRNYAVVVLLLCLTCAVQAAPTAAVADETAWRAAQARFLRDALTGQFAPQAAALARAAPGLLQGIDALCRTPDNTTLEAARIAWIDAMLAWESVNAITFGPALDRRSAYLIDFWPTRPNMIETAIGGAPKTTTDLYRVGIAAKGFPALEWLLWSPGPTPSVVTDPPHCAYARLLAQNIVDEATILDNGFRALVASNLPEERSTEMLTALLNQTIGGLERLRVKKMEKAAVYGNAENFPRYLSNNALKSWLTPWQSIQQFLAFQSESRESSFEAYLRAQGLPAVADKLRAATGKARQVMQGTSQATPVTARRAAKPLEAIQTILEQDVADALHITLGFRETDGD